MSILFFLFFFLPCSLKCRQRLNRSESSCLWGRNLHKKLGSRWRTTPALSPWLTGETSSSCCRGSRGRGLFDWSTSMSRSTQASTSHTSTRWVQGVWHHSNLQCLWAFNRHFPSPPQDVKPQAYRNAYDIPRRILLDQLTRMRSNLMQASQKLIRGQDEGTIHRDGHLHLDQDFLNVTFFTKLEQTPDCDLAPSGVILKLKECLGKWFSVFGQGKEAGYDRGLWWCVTSRITKKKTKLTL